MSGGWLESAWNAAAAFVSAQQAMLYQAISGALGDLKGGEPGALWALISLSFLYGVFHAAGPGHGKAVVASYLASTRDGVARGVALSVASALAQAVTAVAIVGVLSVALSLSRRAVMAQAVWIERASFVLTIALGVWLIVAALRALLRRGAHGHAPGHAHGHHAHDHAHGACCGHEHAVSPATAARLGWAQAGGLVIAIGLRPCSGAIFVLLFALAQGAFGAGVMAAFAMAAGTAITVAAIAILTVFAREGALGLAGIADHRLAAVAVAGLRILAGLALIAMGVILLQTPPPPFAPMPVS